MSGRLGVDGQIVSSGDFGFPLQVRQLEQARGLMVLGGIGQYIVIVRVNHV